MILVKPLMVMEQKNVRKAQIALNIRKAFRACFLGGSLAWNQIDFNILQNVIGMRALDDELRPVFDTV